MRLLLAFILFGLFSCKAKETRETNADILGTWTIDQDESKYSKTGFVDRLTFYPDDSMKLEIYLDGKLSETVTGTYKHDKERNILFSTFDTTKVQAEIVVLTKEKLTLKDHERKVITYYKRL